MGTTIKCKNCNYRGDPKMMFNSTSPTPFCPECGTSDVEVIHVG